MVGLRNNGRLISVQDPDNVLGDVIVEYPAIISSYQILEKLLVVQAEEKRLTDVHSTLFLGIEEKVENPSSEDSVVAKIVEMVYHSGIVAYECSL